MTLAEFLHPLRDKVKGEQVVATLFFFKQQNRFLATASPAKIREALINAQIPRARTANYSSVLSRLVPLVHRDTLGQWEITETGENHVRELLELDRDEPTLKTEDVDALTKLVSSLKDPAVRDYVDESISCLKIGARRASVVFLWSGAIHTLREALWSQQEPSVIDAAFKAHSPKARSFKKKGDFSYFSDAELLQVAQDFEILEKNGKTMLSHALDLRNSCGHPVKYKPGEKKVSSFIEDVLQIVFGVGI